MTPKEKAEELREKCDGYACYAEVVVDEIIKVLNPEHWGLEMNIAIDELIYWREVKQEIESL
jgi:hypothetical protein